MIHELGIKVTKDKKVILASFTHPPGKLKRNLKKLRIKKTILHRKIDPDPVQNSECRNQYSTKEMK